MGRTARSVAAATIALCLVTSAACSSGTPSDEGVAHPGTLTETVSRALASESEKISVVRLCQQVVASAGVMVRDYNAFIKRLNDVQDYAKLGSEARWAVDTLNTGADEVRKAVSPDVPSSIDGQVEAFVSSSERLAEQIDAKRRQALNAASDKWSGDRTSLLDTCSEYLPAGSA
ncbi:hypothetical protein [Gordonia neofelifaecis]|uniref:Lipoprotein n=1 Tax=Gordonia neofelifaecis NRRL B-59395 TaxID=644548 RepID=F1YHC3_9ACTN|nr:hypothetical protein [Gordonia neofelifaecis]EGD55761.1 hypothetical protein SCNU_05955 [Gordonia neofelifaecis NRRL B-59395]